MSVTETSLIKTPDIEMLAENYEKASNTHPNSRVNIERINIITRQVKTAYCFLQNLGKPPSDMSIEEYRLAQSEIRERAKVELIEYEVEYKRTYFFRIFKKMELAHKIKVARFVWDNGYCAYFHECTFFGQWRHHRSEVPSNLPDLVQALYKEKFGYLIDLNKVDRCY